MGGYQPVGIARVLMSIQTSLGAFVVVAMLVFVFARRAAR